MTLWILIALLLAVVVALKAPEAAMKFHVGGEVFLNLLKMLVVPLVVTSVMSGIFGMGDVRKLGKPGGTAIGYYLCTTVLAVLGRKCYSAFRCNRSRTQAITMQVEDTTNQANIPLLY